MSTIVNLAFQKTDSFYGQGFGEGVFAKNLLAD